jgi:hypothetical protein
MRKMVALTIANLCVLANLVAQNPKNEPPSWAMWGGTPARNLVNLAAKELPSTWDVGKGQIK